MSIGGTAIGLIVGTPAYMSPEQARGLPVDARTDVWAFGCVLYEMIASRPAFRGATTSDTIAKILEHDPDWEALPASTPPSIRRLLTRCLDKDPKRRLHAVADANFDLDDALGAGKPATAPGEPRSTFRAGRWLAVATAAALILGAGAGNSPEPFLASTSNEQDASFSHDGSRVAFASDRTGEGHEIWIAQADGSNRRSLTNGTHRPEGSPRWSPNGDRLAFDGLGDDGFRDVYLIDPAGGQIQTIPSKPGVHDQVPSWSRDGKWIYFGSTRSGRFEIWRAPAAGGNAEQVTTTGGECAFESWDGQTLYYVRSTNGVPTLFAMPVAGGREQPMGIQVTFWNYVPAEHGLYYMPPKQGQRPPFTYQVRFFDSNTGQSRLVHTVRLADAGPGLTVTPDGKTVVIQGVAVVTQDLMRIENFR